MIEKGRLVSFTIKKRKEKGRLEAIKKLPFQDIKGALGGKKFFFILKFIYNGPNLMIVPNVGHDLL